MENLKKILFDPETVIILQKEFNRPLKTIYNALNGVHHSELARRIRHRAIMLGLREKGEEKVTILN